VVDPCQSPIIIYRPGAVTGAQISETAGPAEIFKSAGELGETPRHALPSPGVGIRHYAPRARLVLVEGSLAEIAFRLAEAANGESVATLGIMLPADATLPEGLAGAKIFSWGRWSAPRELARDLYAGLRELDALGCSTILCPLPPAEGIGAAIRDRLLKAGKRE
jgi:L-threonylcarbamoyladenylate synthase